MTEVRKLGTPLRELALMVLVDEQQIVISLEEGYPPEVGDVYELGGERPGQWEVVRVIFTGTIKTFDGETRELVGGSGTFRIVLRQAKT